MSFQQRAMAIKVIYLFCEPLCILYIHVTKSSWVDDIALVVLYDYYSSNMRYYDNNKKYLVIALLISCCISPP